MVEIKFNCPHCEQQLEIDDSYYGQTISCPSCQGEILIPEAPRPKAKVAKIASLSSVQTTDAESNVEPVLTLYPVFIPWLAILTGFCLALFFTAWGAGFFGVFGMWAIKVLKLPLPAWSSFVFFGCLFFFGIPFLVYNTAKRTYAKTEYRFYRNRLEYAEGFWTTENKTIKYDKITETSMSRGIIQKKYGLGTISLATPATGFQQGRATSGIRVRDIENPQKVYETVQELVG